MDGVGQTEDGIVVRVNEAFASAFGYASCDEVVGRPWRDLYPPDAQATVADEVLPVVRDGETWRGDTTGLRADGTTFEQTLSVRRGDDGAVLWVVRDVTERHQLEGELREEKRFFENVIDALDDVLYVVDDEGTFAAWNEELCDRFGYSDAEMADVDPRSFLAPSEADELPPDAANMVDLPDRHNVVDLETADGEYITHELYGATYTDERTGDSYRVGIGRDITDRLERERALQRRRDELATLDRINELLLDTVRVLLGTDSRDAVERTVCERLAADDRYRLAWIGRPTLDSDAAVRRTTSAVTGDAPDDLPGDEAVPTADDGAVGRALAAGEVEVSSESPVLGTDDESVAAVPLQHDDHVHGALVVHASTPDGFTEREREGFAVLGRTVGFVVHAARNRQLLFADAVVELEFVVPGDGSLLQDPATELDCELTLDGYVASGANWILYLDVDGAAPDVVRDATAPSDRVEQARVVTTTGGGGRVELVVTESALLDRVQPMGATVRSATVGPDGGRLTIEAPVDADVRDLVDHVRDAFPGATLVSTTRCDRPLSGGDRPGGLLDALTDRQREVLEAAYRGGYFTWPRESTAEAVAESLDIAAPTLHAHLRKAEATIVSRLLDAD